MANKLILKVFSEVSIEEVEKQANLWFAENLDLDVKYMEFKSIPGYQIHTFSVVYEIKV